MPSALPRMTELSFAGWPVVDAELLTAFARGPLPSAARSLTHLNLEACTQVDDESVRLVASALPHLSVVNFNWCTRVTDAGVVALVALTGPRPGRDGGSGGDNGDELGESDPFADDALSGFVGLSSFASAHHVASTSSATGIPAASPQPFASIAPTRSRSRSKSRSSAKPPAAGGQLPTSNGKKKHKKKRKTHQKSALGNRLVSVDSLVDGSGDGGEGGGGDKVSLPSVSSSLLSRIGLYGLHQLTDAALDALGLCRSLEQANIGSCPRLSEGGQQRLLHALPRVVLVYAEPRNP